MTADQIIEQIISLPPVEVKKIAEYIAGEDFSDALEAHHAKKDFLESGEPGIPAEEVFKRFGMKYRIIFTPKAAKQVEKIEKLITIGIKEKILLLQDNPTPHGYVKLSASDPTYRIRISDYHVLYSLALRKI